MVIILFLFRLMLRIGLTLSYIRHEKANLSKMGERFIEYLLEEVKFDT